MDNRFNTIAGWVLGAGAVLLGASLVTGEMFKAHRPHVMGFPIEGVDEPGAGAAAVEQPIAFYLQTADAGRGESSFRKCSACHTIEQGGAQSLGPNLWANMGATIAHVPGYTYSDALRNVGGTWTWEAMSEWLRSPRQFAPGTKMTFAGLGDAQERADIMLYMNRMGGTLQIPPPPHVDTPEQEAAEEAQQPAADGMGAPQAILNEGEAAPGQTGGPAAREGAR